MKNKKYLIFLADDNIMYADLLQTQLEYGGTYEVKKFSKGEDMMKQLSLMPDVIILDYFMDSDDTNALNGLEVLKEMNRRNSNIPVLFLSSLDKAEEIMNIKQEGAISFLYKDDMLFEKLENSLRQIIQLSESENRQAAIEGDH